MSVARGIFGFLTSSGADCAIAGQMLESISHETSPGFEGVAMALETWGGFGFGFRLGVSRRDQGRGDAFGSHEFLSFVVKGLR